MVPVTTAQLDLMVSRLGSWTPALGSVRQAGSDAAVVPAESPPRAKAARARTASSGTGASQRRLRHNVAILPTPASLSSGPLRGPSGPLIRALGGPRPCGSSGTGLERATKDAAPGRTPP